MSIIKHLQSIAQKEELIGEDILIDGDVFEHSIIDANTLIINGSTHKGSTQFTKYATINVHQGSLRCHEAKITLLDFGEIHATTVNVHTATGGSIRAQDVSIKHLKSNVTIYASSSINIEYISGENNKLFINYKEVPILMSKIDLIQDDREELNTALDKAHKDNSPMELEIASEIIRLGEEIKIIQNSTAHAKITIKEVIKTNNTIAFTLDDNNTISYETQTNTYSPFYLSFNKNTIELKPTSQTITLKS